SAEYASGLEPNSLLSPEGDPHFARAVVDAGNEWSLIVRYSDGPAPSPASITQSNPASSYAALAWALSTPPSARRGSSAATATPPGNGRSTMRVRKPRASAQAAIARVFGWPTRHGVVNIEVLSFDAARRSKSWRTSSTSCGF